MKELVIISGKGGTGKTSIAAALATLAAPRVVLADADVDASDLPIVFEPEPVSTQPFRHGLVVCIDPENCIGCGRCAEACRFDAVSMTGPGNDVIGKTYRIDEILCEGCTACTLVCPTDVIRVSEKTSGERFLSQTRAGPLVHAKLFAGEENSGKLVTAVRTQARKLAQTEGYPLLLIDGSPGIGCPVIASITGADAVCVVTEPTVAGLHDLERVLALTRHFEVPALICVNKADLNTGLALQVRERTLEVGHKFIGTVRYDRAFTDAQVARKTVTELNGSGAAEDVRALWRRLCEELGLQLRKNGQENDTEEP